MTRYPRYPAYKDSGVEWLGEIPAHWNETHLKYGYEVQLGKMLTPDPSTEEDSLENYLRSANVYWDGIDVSDVNKMWFSPSEKAQYRLSPGDLIICEGGDVGRSAIWHGELPECYIQNAVHRVRSKDGYFNKFLYYWLFTLKQSGYIDLICSKATISHLTAEKLMDLLLVVPPLPTQRAIAAFLDRQTAHIDAAVAEYRRLTDLLQEKRAALISHTVTQGIDPDIPLKDSGIPTIGQIPLHWKVRRNKHIFEEINERSTTGEEELLTVSHITGVTPRSEKEVNMFLAETFEGYKICRPGDLVINTMWAWMGALGTTEYEGIVSPSYNVYRLRKAETGQYTPKYLDFLYRTPAYVCEITRFSKGVWSSRLRLYPDEFFEMYTPSPPIEEQRAIAAYLDRQTTHIDAAVAEIEAAIAHLEEYRTALISAAVTGKIDVRQT